MISKLICTKYYSAFQGLNKISQQQAAAAVLTCTNFRQKQVKEEETKKRKFGVKPWLKRKKSVGF